MTYVIPKSEFLKKESKLDAGEDAGQLSLGFI